MGKKHEETAAKRVQAQWLKMPAEACSSTPMFFWEGDLAVQSNALRLPFTFS